MGTAIKEEDEGIEDAPPGIIASNMVVATEEKIKEVVKEKEPEKVKKPI
jgi:hypothetical protein